jgi:hypothetical protein
LIGNFSLRPHVVLIFELDLLLIGIFTYAQWVYPSQDQMLGSTDSDDVFIPTQRKRVLIFPVLSLIAIVLASAGFRYSAMVCGIIPLYLIGDAWIQKGG